MQLTSAERRPIARDRSKLRDPGVEPPRKRRRSTAWQPGLEPRDFTSLQIHVATVARQCDLRWIRSDIAWRLLAEPDGQASRCRRFLRRPSATDYGVASRQLRWLSAGNHTGHHLPPDGDLIIK